MSSPTCAAFHAAIERAVPLVEAGWLVTFGITPSAAETGYGYIRRGEEIAPGVQRVERFVEKPDRVTAESYLEDGMYSWNGGIFLFTAASYIAALETHAPGMATAAREAIDKATREGTRIHPEALSFGRSPDVSIDYAVMEKAERVAVVPVDMGWSDVGSWDALHELAIKDLDGNAHHGEVLAIDTTDCLIRSEGPLVVAVGVKDRDRHRDARRGAGAAARRQPADQARDRGAQARRACDAGQALVGFEHPPHLRWGGGPLAKRVVEGKSYERDVCGTAPPPPASPAVPLPEQTPGG